MHSKTLFLIFAALAFLMNADAGKRDNLLLLEDIRSLPVARKLLGFGKKAYEDQNMGAAAERFLLAFNSKDDQGTYLIRGLERARTSCAAGMALSHDSTKQEQAIAIFKHALEIRDPLTRKFALPGEERFRTITFILNLCKNGGKIDQMMDLCQKESCRLGPDGNLILTNEQNQFLQSIHRDLCQREARSMPAFTPAHAPLLYQYNLSEILPEFLFYGTISVDPGQGRQVVEERDWDAVDF